MIKLARTAATLAFAAVATVAAPAFAATEFANTGTMVQVVPAADDAQSFGDNSNANGGAYYYTFTTDRTYNLAFIDAGTLNGVYVDNPFTIYSGSTPGAGTVEGVSILGTFAEGLTESLPAGTYNLYVPSTTLDEGLTGSVSASVAGVPEPAAWALMLIGVGAVGGAMRRRAGRAAIAAA